MGVDPEALVDGALALIGVQATSGEYALALTEQDFSYPGPGFSEREFGAFWFSFILRAMGPFGNIGTRMRLVQGMMENVEECACSRLWPRESGQIEAIDPWRTFLCFNDPRIRWSLQREAYAGLLAEGVNFSSRDGGVITAAGVAVDAASRGLVFSTEGVEWRKASGVDLYIVAHRLKIKGWDAPKRCESAEPFVRTALLVQKMLDRDPKPSVLGGGRELIPALFADRSLRGLRRSSMRVAADSMVEQVSRNVNESPYQDPKWMRLQHVFHDPEKVVKSDESGSEEKEEAYRWRSGWRDMCSEWFVLMLSNHVERALHDADAFVRSCKEEDRVLPEPLKHLNTAVENLRPTIGDGIKR